MFRTYASTGALSRGSSPANAGVSVPVPSVRRVHLSPPAYRVPFRFERPGAAGSHRLVNVSDETVHGVTFVVHGPGLLAVSAPATLAPGHGVAVGIAARDLARSTILVVRWFRHDGLEYVWLVSF